MTAENFCYWLQGILEIQMAGIDANEKRVPKLSDAEIQMVQQHLSYVVGPKPTFTVTSGYPYPTAGSLVGAAGIAGAKIC